MPTVTPDPSLPGYRLENEYADANWSAVKAPALSPSDWMVDSHPDVAWGPPARGAGPDAAAAATAGAVASAWLVGQASSGTGRLTSSRPATPSRSPASAAGTNGAA